MKKRFVARKKVKYRKLKIVLWMIIAILTFWISLSILVKTPLGKVLNNEKLSVSMFEIGTLNTEKKEFNLLSPTEMFNLGLNYVLKVDSNDYPSFLVMDPESNDKTPRIYIYNTHENEEYDSNMLNAYSLTYTVKTASFIFRDYLKDYGIPSFVEQESISKYLSNNNLMYKDSYTASRYYINERIKEYPSIEYFIDIHRDSALKDKTSIEIDGITYAKVMFVVGLDYVGYESNLQLAENLSLRLGEISRGISKKTGPKVNGIYNQDLSNKSLLIEVGGIDNNIEEVNNTLKVLSKVIFEYINEGN